MDFSALQAKDECYDIVIKHDGSWWHEGAEIKRMPLIKLFSTVLKYDADKNEYWLITPAEAGRIKVEDVPFLIVDFEYEQGLLKCRNNIGQEIIVGADHPLTLQKDRKTDQILPYVEIRQGIKARFSRSMYYNLVTVASVENGQLVIMSQKQRYNIGQVEETC